MRTGNPALSQNTFDIPAAYDVAESEVMTLEGAINKSALLLVLTLATATVGWSMPAYASILAPVGAIVGLGIAIAIIFKKTWAPVLAPVYALVEGLVLGAISMLFEAMYPGIVVQAIGLTFAVFAALLLAYRSGVIRATENFKLGVFAATAGIAVFYLVGFVLSLFGIHAVSNLHSVNNASYLSIGISVFVVVIAALNLVLDFDFIEKGAEMRAPKYMEWYSAFALLVTLIWLYIEILRLLAKLQSRD